MTISTTTASELNRDAFIRRGMQLAGVWDSRNPLLADDIDALTDCIRVEMQSLIAEGLLEKWATRQTLTTVVAGTATYPLPSTVLDVCVGSDRLAGTFTQTGATSETRVYAITAEEYLGITNKTSPRNIPRQVLIERSDTTVNLTFYQTPSISGTFAYRGIRVVRDDDTGVVTLDIPRPFQKAMLHQVAYYACLIKKGSESRAGFLRSEAQRLKRQATGWDSERLPTQFRAR